MVHQPETQHSRLLQLESWEEIIHSPSWRIFRNLLEEHKIFLQKEVNVCLKKHQDREAGEALRALEDCDKIMQLVTSKISSLREKKENGNGTNNRE